MLEEYTMRQVNVVFISHKAIKLVPGIHEF